MRLQLVDANTLRAKLIRTTSPTKAVWIEQLYQLDEEKLGSRFVEEKIIVEDSIPPSKSVDLWENWLSSGDRK